MLAINSLNAAIFMSGTEGGILIAICIIAALCTLAVIALAITVILSVKRRKRENVDEVFEPINKEQPPEQAEQSEQSETGQPPAEVIAETPAETPTEIRKVYGQARTNVTSAIFSRGATLYNKSFTAKLIQSDDVVKSWYADLKNELLSYKKVKSRISWKRESFRLGRKITARFGYRGNTLCIYLPLDPVTFAESKYKVENVSDYAAYADTPCMYRLKNARRARYAAELIESLMSTWGIERIERTAEDYYLPYEDTEPLIERGLIKVVNVSPKQSVSQDNDGEVEEVTEEVVGEADEVAAAEVPEEQPIDEVEVAEMEVAEEEPTEEPAEEAEEISEEVADSEPTEETTEEAEIEGLSAKELDDVETYEEKTKDEDGIEVVGVMFRRRGRKVYWFDPDGKTWEKGEIALYKSPDNPPQEVIVVDNAKISPNKLHLPLKPLHKAPRRPQTYKNKPQKTENRK